MLRKKGLVMRRSCEGEGECFSLCISSLVYYPLLRHFQYILLNSLPSCSSNVFLAIVTPYIRDFESSLSRCHSFHSCQNVSLFNLLS